MLQPRSNQPTHPDATDGFLDYLWEFSARIAGISPDEMEAVLRDAVKRLCGTFKLDRVSLWEFMPDDAEALLLTHLFDPSVAASPLDGADGRVQEAGERVFRTSRGPIAVGVLSTKDFPWFTARALAGQTSVIARVEDLPLEASRDAESLRRFGTTATVVVPLLAYPRPVGALTFAQTTGERDWPPSLVRRFELAAMVFARALARKRSSLVGREHAVQLELAASAAGAGLWDIELASGRLRADAEARRLYGLAPNIESTFDDVLSAVHPDDRQIVSNRRSWATGHLSAYDDEYRVLSPEGGVRWLLVRGRAFAVSPGHPPTHAFGVVLDITERKEAERKLADALDESARLREQLGRENVSLRAEVSTLRGPVQIVGRSPAIRRALAAIEQVAPTTSTVLLLGETGCGKGRFAAALHALSPRRALPMVHVNCAAIPPSLIESELFGREKGAYTGALTKQIGRFELASGSTLFLDEIGDLPLELQVKLLRVLEERTIERLGSPRPVPIDVRIIAATHQDLLAAQRAGQFREDLFYRLNVFPIRVPPLRERPEDIPLLVSALVSELSSTMGRRVDAVPKDVMQALMQHPWPGNIRELRNTVERAMITATGTTLNFVLPLAGDVPVVAGVPRGEAAQRTIADVERAHMLSVLHETGWRIRGEKGAAALLGMRPTTLENRMKKLGITRPHKANDPA